MRAVEPQSPIQALRTLADNLLGAVRERVALLSLEVEEERDRLLISVVWISAAMVAAALTLIFASVTLVYVFWDTARLTVLGCLTAFYAAGFAAIALALRRYLLRQPRPFAATLAEIDQDRSCLNHESS